jgi:restriction endonuclease S subunit
MISDMDINYPINLKEQGKIANLLTELDSLITLHQRKYLRGLK